MSNNSSVIEHHPEDALARIVSLESGIHAVLLYGAEGAPLDECAVRLTQGWLCTSKDGDRPCGKCRSCGSMEKGSHVDLKRIVRGGAGSVIKISQITPRPEDKENPPEASLQEFFRTAALMSNRKVVIIQDAERMNSQAANALLKILEEPHSYAKLILTTNYLSSLLPTTLSRCVCIPIELPAGSESHLRPRFEAFANKLRHAKKQQMLVLSEEFRALCNTIELEDGSGARLSQAKALSLLAAAMIQTDPDRPDRVHHVIDAHRRILGNASSSLLFDALFASIA